MPHLPCRILSFAIECRKLIGEHKVASLTTAAQTRLADELERVLSQVIQLEAILGEDMDNNLSGGDREYLVWSRRTDENRYDIVKGIVHDILGTPERRKMGTD
jgi:hypothetical protein